MIIALSFRLFSEDAELLRRLHATAFSRETWVTRLAIFLGTWGDYLTYNLPLALLLWFYGIVTKSRAWRRTAVICFLGGTLAGLFDDCFRLTLGRPRPDAGMPDGFYGLHSAFHSRFQSFPSGHAAAVFGTAMSLFSACRWLGAITILYALLVVWARMQLNRHYPSDVLIGTIIGIAIGFLVGLGAKVLRPAAQRRSK